MWPYDPDDFESSLERPDSLEDGQLFVVCDDDLLTTARDGVWQPLTFDEYRWLDLEIHSEQYLGRFRGRPCLTIAATLRSSVPPGYAAVPLRALLGRVEAPLFYLAGRAIQVSVRLQILSPRVQKHSHTTELYSGPGTMSGLQFFGSCNLANSSFLSCT